MHKSNSLSTAFYYTFIDFCRSQEQTLMFHHFLKLLYHTFSKINLFMTSNFRKDFHQDNLSFACLQFSKHTYLNILEGNISCCIQQIQIQAKNKKK